MALKLNSKSFNTRSFMIKAKEKTVVSIQWSFLYVKINKFIKKNKEINSNSDRNICIQHNLLTI